MARAALEQGEKSVGHRMRCGNATAEQRAKRLPEASGEHLLSIRATRRYQEENCAIIAR
jgi:hypothetical protein